MSNFAVITTGGKQYKVSVGTTVRIEKLLEEAGKSVTFDKVLLVADGDKVSVGAPYVAGAKVTGEVLRQFRDEKKIIFKFSSKTRYRRKKGHRQNLTEVKITKI
ncbi:MAG: 50S ribosomal protein L21 [bacterium]|nr:50S ribosomal protein L21 [bacterium]